MTIAPAITTLKIGDTAALELRAIFSDRPAGTIRSELVNQTSDNPNVVTIAPSGSVTDIGAGTGAIIARITAQPALADRTPDSRRSAIISAPVRDVVRPRDAARR